MEALTYIKAVEELTALSPLRRENLQLNLSYDLAEVEKVTADLKLLEEKCQTPLKLVLMGEVKAGKSTLLNALAGGLVAPTDVTETTAAIMLITYGAEPEGVIYFTNGETTLGKPEEIFAILGTHQNDQDYFSHCDHVEIKLPLEPLKSLHIVDTPGLMTITATNAERTENYFQQSDVVLWVLNAHYLGQSDVNEELERVADMGKPIVGVLNRIDEMEGEPSKLVRYVKRELGIYLEDVFPLSAKLAFEAVMAQDEAGQRQSGFTDLAYYLEHNIERQADAVQNDSLINSTKAVLGKELLLHQAVLAEIDSKLLLLNRSYEKMQQQSEYIRNKQESQVDSWFNQDFLAAKEQLIQEKIQQISVMSMGASATNLKHTIQECFSEGAIRQEIDEFLQRLDDNVRSDWQNQLVVVTDQVAEEYEALLHRYHVQAQTIMDRLPDASKTALEGAGEGTIAAGVFGGALATYSAVLGPAAAHISIGSALGAVMPPLLIAGAVTGAVMGLVRYRNVKAGYAQMVAQAVNNIRTDVKSKILPGIRDAINGACDNMVVGVHDRLMKENFDGHTEEEVVALRTQLEQYTKLLEEKLQ